MAKGRKGGSNRHERLLGINNGSVNGSGGGGGNDGTELVEEDMWAMVHDGIDHDDHMRHVSTNNWSYRGAESNGDHRIRSQRWVAREDRQRQVGGLSLAFDESGRTQPSRIVHQIHAQESQRGHRSHRQTASSAPVNVPDWSKILRVSSVESLHDSDEGLDEDDSSCRIPPHEYLAREYARSQKMRGTSVFEGVGRTLKGRDMSRVRDAVWSQTGFDG